MQKRLLDVCENQIGDFVFHNYGQIPRIDILPVTESRILRANPKKRYFARNRRLIFTGKSQEALFCP
ncbi:hypothetical protein HMPREF0542_12106 [Ligilactobacillus ruminis ATCC 25644]|uniref:Uncharacterized protein n=1 Tax=Ligilactobacillus ruminis ATCC 25644 TaxID=525362 RepID=E7FT78_9LACO|nr:hypothetical protein HMPREF0542_12106 [Ligilactobacillus ruminis ATCC 25644]